MAEKKKRDTFTSPVGTFKWASLGKPDTKYKPEGEYRVTLSLPKDGMNTAAFLAKLDADHKMAVQAVKEQLAADPKTKAKVKTLKTSNAPYKTETAQEGNETNNILINFKAKAGGTYVDKKTGEKKTWTFKPVLFDAMRNPLDPKIQVWGGTVGRVSYQIDSYYVAASGEAGLSLKLQAAQILTLKTGSGRDAASYGFEEEEGYVSEPATGDDLATSNEYSTPPPADGGDF